MKYTFKGGTHLPEYKHTKGQAIVELPPPETVSIPLAQHIGAPCTPTVQVGDTVLLGQVIGDVEGGLGCPVHASVSGKVIDIRERSTPSGARMREIVIENDGKNTPAPNVRPFEKKITEASTEEIIDAVRCAGISGMGGASFPTYAKMKSALGKVNRLIVNCAECEPFITVNHRLMLEEPEALIGGTKILLVALGLKRAVFAIEDNKDDAIKQLERAVEHTGLISVRVMKTKYPQGDERQLIYALTGKELPMGKLPADVGCVIFNAETCAAIYRAFVYGMPLVRRAVTVDGDCVRTPKNVLVPIGTSYRDLIAFCGGFVREPYKIINGGPMMGIAQWDLDTPVTKGTSAVLFFSRKMEKRYTQPSTCIRCGRCVRGCPMHLMPNYIAASAKAGDLAGAEKYGALSCVECGTCSYNCPGHVPIVQYIRMAKGEIKAKKAVLR